MTSLGNTILEDFLEMSERWHQAIENRFICKSCNHPLHEHGGNGTLGINQYWPCQHKAWFTVVSIFNPNHVDEDSDCSCQSFVRQFSQLSLLDLID